MKKSGRTPGIHSIPAELYKADNDVVVKELTRLLMVYGMGRRYLTSGRKVA